ncbi:MAG: hypothetical protein JWP49_769, partial [Phenylobacterium sp.]|nr:hypothetical protein [Phenylobacterium sp.]
MSARHIRSARLLPGLLAAGVAAALASCG